MSVLTRIKNNQIQDSGIWANAKIIPGSIVGSLFNSSMTITSDFTITGNLTVQGSSTYLTVASTNTYVNDPLIVLNNAFAGSNSYDLGFIFNRGSDTNQAFYWDESSDEFRLIATSESGTTYGSITAETSFANIRLGNLRAQYNLTASTIDATGFINTTGNISAAVTNTGALNVSGTSTVAGITASGFINTAGNVSAAVTNAGALNVTGLSTLNTINASGFINAAGNISSAVTNAGALNVTGLSTLNTINASGFINAAGNISAAVLNGGAINSTGLINTTGNVSASEVHSATLVVSGASTLAAVNSSGFINTTGNLSAAVTNTGALNVTGTSTLAATNISGFVNAAGNISAAVLNGGAINSTGLINTTGNVSASTVNAAQVNASGNVSATQINTGTLKASALTTGRVIYTSTAGLLVDNAGLTFTANTLTVGGALPITVDGTTATIATTTTNQNLILAPNGSGSVDFNGALATNLADPVSGSDAVTLTHLNTALSSEVTNLINDDSSVYIYDTGANGRIEVKVDADLVANITQDSTTLTNDVIVSNTTASTTTTSGAFQVVGGVGIGGAVVAGGQIKGTATTQSTNTTSGAIITAGGVGVAKNLNVGGDVVITGNLTVDGVTTTVNSATLTVDDLNITVASGAGSSAAADGAGLTVDGAGATLLYTHATTSWNINKLLIGTAINVSGNVSASGLLGATLNVSGTSTLAGVNASGFINAAGNISAAILNGGAINSTGLINTTGNISAATTNTGALNVTGTSTVAGITASGFINTAGNVSASEVHSATLVVSGASTLAGITASGFINTTGNVSAAVTNTGALNVTGTSTVAAINSSGFINTTGNVSAAVTNTGALNVSGTSTVAAINSSGFINTTGNVSAAVLNGGAINSTGLINTTGNVSAATVNAAHVNASGNVSATEINTGTIKATGYINTAGNISTAQLNAGQINTTGNVLAQAGVFNAVTVNGNETITGYLNVTGNVLADVTNVSKIITANVVAAVVNVIDEYAGTIAATTITVTDLSSSGTIYANASTDTSSLTTGALVVTGGTAVGKTMWVGEGARINSTQSAEAFYVLGQGSGSSLIYADAAKNAIVFGGANVTVQDGVVAKFNSTGAIRVPVGTSSQRPGSTGNVDVTGLLRFNTTSTNLEFYDGSAWTSAGSEFTVITTNNFTGDGSTVAFTLSSSSTTAGTFVMINGVVQIPTTAYSVSGTTLTFTEAPAAGDAIDARVLITTATVSTLASGNGYNTFDVATTPYANITAGTSSPTVRVSVDGVSGTVTFTNDVVINGQLTVKGDTAGNINIGDQSTDKVQLQGTIVYNQTALNAPGTNLKELDSFSTSAYSTAKYLFQIKDGANIESGEILLAQDTANISLTTYAVIAPAGALGTFSCNIVSGSAKLWYTPTISTNANIKVQTTYIV